MNDPRYPSAFQRPGSAATPASAEAPAPDRTQPSEGTSPVAPIAAPDAVGRPHASARTAPAPSTEPPATGRGNRIVLLGGTVEDEPLEQPISRRNLAIGGLYALAGVLLALALLGGLWSQGMLRGVAVTWSGSVNPDRLQELTFSGAEPGAVGIARLLVQLAPTTLALGVLALLVAIVLPVLTRRPR